MACPPVDQPSRHTRNQSLGLNIAPASLDVLDKQRAKSLDGTNALTSTFLSSPTAAFTFFGSRRRAWIWRAEANLACH